MKSILLAGSTGYVGSSVKEFLQNYFDVIDTTRNYNNSSPFILNEHKCDDIPNEVNDIVICLGSTEMQNNSYALSSQSSVVTICRLIDKLLNSRKKDLNIVYISTFQVYGTYSGRITEKTKTNAQSIYALTHFQAEQCLKLFARSSQSRLKILRPTNIYGSTIESFPYRRSSLVPNCFIEEAITHGHITIKANTPVYRNFVSIHKLNSIILYVLKNETPEMVSNVCGDHTLELSEIATIVSNIISKLTHNVIKIKCPNRENKILLDPAFKVESNIDSDSINKYDQDIETAVELLSKYYYQTFQGASSSIQSRSK